MVLSIIIPVFNEEKNLKKVLVRVKELELVHKIEKEVIIINDGSNDSSLGIIEEFMMSTDTCIYKFDSHNNNEGKGAAIQSALKISNGDYIVIQDADLEYNPKDINKLLEKVIENESRVVYGSRLMPGSEYYSPFVGHRYINIMLTKLSNLFTGFKITDLQTCYKLFKADILKKIDLKETGFGFETEVTLKLAHQGIGVVEVPISYSGRRYREHKKIGIKDGFRCLYCLLKY